MVLQAIAVILVQLLLEAGVAAPGGTVLRLGRRAPAGEFLPSSQGDNVNSPDAVVSSGTSSKQSFSQWKRSNPPARNGYSMHDSLAIYSFLCEAQPKEGPYMSRQAWKTAVRLLENVFAIVENLNPENIRIIPLQTHGARDPYGQWNMLNARMTRKRQEGYGVKTYSAPMADYWVVALLTYEDITSTECTLYISVAVADGLERVKNLSMFQKAAPVVSRKEYLTATLGRRLWDFAKQYALLWKVGVILVGGIVAGQFSLDPVLRIILRDFSVDISPWGIFVSSWFVLWADRAVDTFYNVKEATKEHRVYSLREEVAGVAQAILQGLSRAFLFGFVIGGTIYGTLTANRWAVEYFGSKRTFLGSPVSYLGIVMGFFGSLIGTVVIIVALIELPGRLRTLFEKTVYELRQLTRRELIAKALWDGIFLALYSAGTPFIAYVGYLWGLTMYPEATFALGNVPVNLAGVFWAGIIGSSYVYLIRNVKRSLESIIRAVMLSRQQRDVMFRTEAEKREAVIDTAVHEALVQKALLQAL